MSKLNTTSTERIYPERELPGIVSIHLKRYQFALEYCRNKKVLDAACGVGYGAHYLTQAASNVTGIDIDPNAIDYGRDHFHSDRLSLQVSDVMKTNFRDGQFDVICSFETIEHLPNITAYLKEMVRLLHPEGVYLASTPQALKTNHRPSNPYHTVEFSRKDFTALLHQYFDQVDLYGQCRKQSGLHYGMTRLLDVTGLRRRLPKLSRFRNFVNQSLQTTPYDQMSLDDLLITKEKIDRASELIAICRTAK